MALSMMSLVFAVLAVPVLTTSPLFPGCPVKDQYLPCECPVIWQKSSLELICTDVPMVIVKSVLHVAMNNSHNFNELTIKHENVSELPDNLFEGVHIRKLKLNLPKLVNLSTEAFSGQEENIEELSITASQLSDVPVEAISTLNKLKQFTLARSPYIKFFNNETFSKLKNIDGLTLLSFSDDGLVEIQEGSFAGFKNLEYLSLDNNKITEFNIDALPEHRLKSFSLSGLPLKNFPIEAVPKVEKNGWLSLENMNITTVLPEQLDAFISEGVLGNLRNNPIDCDCSFRRIAKLLEVHPYDYDVIGKCYTPSKLWDRNIFTLRSEDFSHCV